jgi:branched-chain amino acid aminotransferase
VTDWDVITPPLDGTILPGVTRSSALNLTSAHPSHTILTPLPHTLRLYAREQVITMSDLSRWSANGRLLECFAVGTAVVVAPVGRIGLEGQDDIILPGHKGGLGPLARALWERMVEIQEGRVEWEGWCVLCE